MGAVNPRTYDEYTREDFSFGNRNDLKLEDIDKDGPRLDNKFGSTSTAELTPKLPEDEAAKSMPPSTVMIKLIAVMTFRKLIWNPNTYSSLLGVIWSLVAFRYLIRVCRRTNFDLASLSFWKVLALNYSIVTIWCFVADGTLRCR